MEDNSLEIHFTTHLSDGKEIELKPRGATLRVSADNSREYVSLVLQQRLNECATQVAAIRRGINTIVRADVSFFVSTFVFHSYSHGII